MNTKLLTPIFTLLFCGAVHAGQQSTTMNVSADLIEACGLSASNMNFGAGTFDDLVNNGSAQATITVSCPETMDWTISLDAGLHAGSGTSTSRRLMPVLPGGSPSSHFEYTIFYDNNGTQTNWGNGHNTAQGNPRSGAGNMTMTARGDITGGDPSSSQGQYTDVVIVTLDY